MSTTSSIVRVVAPVTKIFRHAQKDAPVESEILFGHLFKVRSTSSEFLFGQALSPIPESADPDYEGYILAAHTTPYDAPPSYKISALKAPLFSTANIKGPIEKVLHLGSDVSGEIDGDFLNTPDGFIHKRHLTPFDTYENDFVAQAERFLGLPYIWGGNSSDGLDCSGLVRSALRLCGQDAPRDSSQQVHMGTSVMDKPRQRGDLVFWKGHVGIMQSATQLFHANAHHMSVASEPLSEAVSRIQDSAGPVTDIRRFTV